MKLHRVAAPPAGSEGSCCSASSAAFGVSVPDFGPSNGCVMVSYFCFKLHFPDDIWCETCFHVIICHLYIFFVEVCVKVFGSFFNWVVFMLLNFKSTLYILDIGPLSDVSFTNIFSYSVAYLLILLTLSVAEQKFLTLMKSHLLFLSFKENAFGVAFAHFLIRLIFCCIWLVFKNLVLIWLDFHI